MEGFVWCGAGLANPEFLSWVINWRWHRCRIFLLLQRSQLPDARPASTKLFIDVMRVCPERQEGSAVPSTITPDSMPNVDSAERRAAIENLEPSPDDAWRYGLHDEAEIRLLWRRPCPSRHFCYQVETTPL